jgi:hypothetical protein
VTVRTDGTDRLSAGAVARSMTAAAAGHGAGQVTWFLSLIVLGAIAGPPGVRHGRRRPRGGQFRNAPDGRRHRRQHRVHTAPRPGQIRSSMRLNLALGAVMTAALVVLARPITERFASGGDPRVLQWLAPAIALHAFAVVPIALLRKQMQFGRQSAATFVAYTVAGATAVGWGCSAPASGRSWCAWCSTRVCSLRRAWRSPGLSCEEAGLQRSRARGRRAGGWGLVLRPGARQLRRIQRGLPHRGALQPTPSSWASTRSPSSSPLRRCDSSPGRSAGAVLRVGRDRRRRGRAAAARHLAATGIVADVAVRRSRCRRGTGRPAGVHWATSGARWCRRSRCSWSQACCTACSTSGAEFLSGTGNVDVRGAPGAGLGVADGRVYCCSSSRDTGWSVPPGCTSGCSCRWPSRRLVLGARRLSATVRDLLMPSTTVVGAVALQVVVTSICLVVLDRMDVAGHRRAAVVAASPGCRRRRVVALDRSRRPVAVAGRVVVVQPAAKREAEGGAGDPAVSSGTSIRPTRRWCRC